MKSYNIYDIYKVACEYVNSIKDQTPSMRDFGTSRINKRKRKIKRKRK